MKKIIIAVILAATMIGVSGCGSFSSMSSEDAYNIGYGAGTLLRNLYN